MEGLAEDGEECDREWRALVAMSRHCALHV